MSERQFIVTDIDFQATNNADIDMQNDVLVKAEDVKEEENILLFPQDGVGDFSTSPNNYQIVDDFTSGNVPTFTFSDNTVSQLLNGMTSNFTKLPLELGAPFKTEDMKSERSSHYIKYRMQDGKHTKVWECGICSKEFGHQYTLMRHLPTHTDERKFRCNTCGKAFRQMSTLSQHRAIHSAERPYVCEICHKTFNRVSTLISHRKTHTGQKPHQCHLCNKAFHQKGNLRNHIFTHTNERPYKCDICSKGFNQMSNLMCHKLKAHQRSDKPKYSCQICGKDFQKRMGLRTHEQYQHGVHNNENAIISTGPTRIKYTNGILVDPINTDAMHLALATNQTPFALLRPMNGIPVLVRVLSAGEKQMLVPATAEDLKKHAKISITPKSTNEEGGDSKDPLEQDNNNEEVAQNNTEESDKPGGSTVQIKIPIVATVVQRCGKDGNLCMAVESPGPSTEDINNDSYVFTTTNADNELTEEGTNIDIIVNEMQKIDNQVVHFIADKNGTLHEEEFKNTNQIYQQNFPFATNQEVFTQNMQLQDNVLNLEENKENIQQNFLKEINPETIFNVEDNDEQQIQMLDANEDVVIKTDENDNGLNSSNILYEIGLNSDYVL